MSELTWDEDNLKACPNCGCDEIFRESVDIGVGIQYGPWGCPQCMWSSYEEYDLSKGQPRFDEKGGMIDQWGSYYPPGNFEAKVSFKLYKEEMEKAGKPLEFMDEYH